MQTPISVQDKRSFIKWFLNQYQLKSRESVWILNYLTNHKDILANVHFVRHAKFCPRGIVIASRCSGERPFRFYKDHLVTTDTEKTFHDIRLNRDQPLYIELDFEWANRSTFYVAVLEENPYTPDSLLITKADKENAKNLLDTALFEFQQNALKQKIDLALDQMDKSTFEQLVEELNQLNKRNLN